MSFSPCRGESLPLGAAGPQRLSLCTLSLLNSSLKSTGCFPAPLACITQPGLFAGPSGLWPPFSLPFRTEPSFLFQVTSPPGPPWSILSVGSPGRCCRPFLNPSMLSVKVLGAPRVLLCVPPLYTLNLFSVSAFSVPLCLPPCHSSAHLGGQGQAHRSSWSPVQCAAHTRTANWMLSMFLFLLQL